MMLLINLLAFGSSFPVKSQSDSLRKGFAVGSSLQELGQESDTTWQLNHQGDSLLYEVHYKNYRGNWLLSIIILWIIESMQCAHFPCMTAAQLTRLYTAQCQTAHSHKLQCEQCPLELRRGQITQLDSGTLLLISFWGSRMSSLCLDVSNNNKRSYHSGSFTSFLSPNRGN